MQKLEDNEEIIGYYGIEKHERVKIRGFLVKVHLTHGTKIEHEITQPVKTIDA